MILSTIAENSEMVSNYGSVYDYANLPFVQYIKELWLDFHNGGIWNGKHVGQQGHAQVFLDLLAIP